MKIAYFDCFAGASGDMILGALLDAGLDIRVLRSEIAKLGLSGYELDVKNVVRKNIAGSQALVIIHDPKDLSLSHSGGRGHRHDREHRHEHHLQHGSRRLRNRREQASGNEHDRRNLGSIRKIIEDSDLSENVKEKSVRVFTGLAEAEAKVHGISVEEVHFHEVGAMDSIIDIVGGIAGLEAMGIDSIHCSPLNVGCGTVECAHGTLPVPAPATLQLIRGKPIYSTGVVGELLTPTGAAILTAIAERFGPMPGMTVETVGYGSGQKDYAIPNFLRVCIGKKELEIKPYSTEKVAVVETNIDDMNPQVYDYLMQKLLSMGVLDVLLAPVQMKKNRPGTMVKVICAPEMVAETADLLIRETTSIGLRWRLEHRFVAKRRIEAVDTPYGPIACKVATSESGEVLNVFPEYEDCKKAATEKKVPIREVMEKAREAASKIFF